MAFFVQRVHFGSSRLHFLFAFEQSLHDFCLVGRASGILYLDGSAEVSMLIGNYVSEIPRYADAWSCAPVLSSA